MQPHEECPTISEGCNSPSAPLYGPEFKHSRTIRSDIKPAPADHCRLPVMVRSPAGYFSVINLSVKAGKDPGPTGRPLRPWLLALLRNDKKINDRKMNANSSSGIVCTPQGERRGRAVRAPRMQDTCIAGGELRPTDFTSAGRFLRTAAARCRQFVRYAHQTRQQAPQRKVIGQTQRNSLCS